MLANKKKAAAYMYAIKKVSVLKFEVMPDVCSAFTCPQAAMWKQHEALDDVLNLLLREFVSHITSCLQYLNDLQK